MPHRNHAAVRVGRGDSHKYREVFIWLVICLVLYVMIRFVLIDLVHFARLPAPPVNVSWSVPAVVKPAASP